MPKVIVPEAYRGPTKGLGSVEVAASTAREAIESVERDHPGFGALVFDGQGGIHKFVKLFVNGDQLAADELDRPLEPGDEVEVLAAIAGG